MTIVDTHAHAFTHQCELVEGRRYTPDCEAPLADYLSELDRTGVSYGVLVQPSFLGTDNSFLLECLVQIPERLRGIAVIDPSFDDAAMATLSDGKIVGLRLNLFGVDPGYVASPEWQRLFGRAADHDWQIELHASSDRLAFLLSSLWPSGAKLVVDHFGRPDANSGASDVGIKALLAKAASGRIWIKLSGPYRFQAPPTPHAQIYLDAFGPERLLWGSDWPWTQHSAGMTYQKALSWIEEWVPRRADRELILGQSALKLFKFNVPSAEHPVASADS